MRPQKAFGMINRFLIYLVKPANSCQLWLTMLVHIPSETCSHFQRPSEYKTVKSTLAQLYLVLVIPMKELNPKPSLMRHDRSRGGLVYENFLSSQHLLGVFTCCLIVTVLVGWLQGHTSAVLDLPALLRCNRYDIMCESHDWCVRIFGVELNRSVIP